MSVSSVMYTDASSTTSTATVSTYSDMDSNQFMQLLLVELKNQDPLEPMDSNEIMGQITQLNSLQELQSINSGIEALSDNDDLLEAAALLNRTVTYVTDSSLTASGVVTGISRFGNTARLLIGEDEVSLDDVMAVEDPQEAI